MMPTTLYHLTSKVDFRLDPKKRPVNNTTLGGTLDPGIFLTADVGYWTAGYGYWQPWVVEFTVPSDLTSLDGVIKGYGNEVYVPARHYDKLKVSRVIPLDAHAREEWGDWGWVEWSDKITFDTEEPIPPKGPLFSWRGYRYSGDARNTDSAWRDRYTKRVKAHRRNNKGIIASVTSAFVSPSARAQFADEIYESLSTELSEEALRSWELWVESASAWPRQYLAEAQEEPFSSAFRANLKRMGFPSVVTLRRNNGLPSPLPTIINASISSSWGISPTDMAGKPTKVVEFTVPLEDIIAFGWENEGEVFVRTKNLKVQEGQKFAMAVPEFKGTDKNLSKKQVVAACQRILKDIAREFGYTGKLPEIILSPDLPGTIDGRSIDPSREFPDGAILLNEDFWLPNAQAKDAGYSSFRILAHEAIHAIIQQSEKSYEGFSQIITEGGAEVLSVWYWAKNAPEFDDRDAIRENGEWVPGDRAMVNSLNYEDWVEEVIRRAASIVGWNRDAIVAEIKRAVAGNHTSKLSFRDRSNPSFSVPSGVQETGKALMMWLIEGRRKVAMAASPVTYLGEPRLKYDYYGKPERVAILDHDAGAPLSGHTYFTVSPVETTKSRIKRQEWDEGKGVTKTKPKPKFYENTGTADPGTVAFLDFFEYSDSLFIAFVNTRPDQRGQTYATQLIDWVYAEAKKRGKEYVNWGTVFHDAQKLFWRYSDNPPYGLKTVGKPLDRRESSRVKHEWWVIRLSTNTKLEGPFDTEDDARQKERRWKRQYPNDVGCDSFDVTLNDEQSRANDFLLRFRSVPGVWHDPHWNGGEGPVTLVEGGSRWGHGGFYGTLNKESDGAVFVKGPFKVMSVRDETNGSGHIWQAYSSDEAWNELLLHLAGVSTKAEFKQQWTPWEGRMSIYRKIAEYLRGLGFDGVEVGGELVIWKYTGVGYKVGKFGVIRRVAELSGSRLWWRIHPSYRPFLPEEATSTPIDNWKNEPPAQGYSAVANPWHLWVYAATMGWLQDRGSSKAWNDDVIGFTGEMLGGFNPSDGWDRMRDRTMGHDGEPLIIPDMKIVERYSWEEFERELLDTPFPHGPLHGKAFDPEQVIRSGKWTWKDFAKSLVKSKGETWSDDSRCAMIANFIIDRWLGKTIHEANKELSMVGSANSVWFRGITLEISKSVAHSLLQALNSGRMKDAAAIVVEWAQGDQNGYNDGTGIGPYWSKDRLQIESYYAAGGNLVCEAGQWKFQQGSPPRLGVIFEAVIPQESMQYHNRVFDATPISLSSVSLWTHGAEFSSGESYWTNIPVSLSTTASMGGIRLVAGNNVWKVVSVVDTREFVEGENDKWYPVSGSGDLRPCDRCGKQHEIHATVEDAEGNIFVVGVGCARIGHPELDASLKAGQSAATTFAKNKAAVDSLTKRLAIEANVRDEVDRLPPPSIVLDSSRSAPAGAEWMMTEDGRIRQVVYGDRKAAEATMIDHWRQSVVRERLADMGIKDWAQGSTARRLDDAIKRLNKSKGKTAANFIDRLNSDRFAGILVGVAD